MGNGKKKLDTELNTYFPSFFGSDVSYLDKLRELYLLKAQEGAEEKDLSEAIKNCYSFFLDLNTPKVFNPYRDEWIVGEQEKEFEEMCSSMEEVGCNGVKDYTVFEFYSRVQYLEKKAAKLRNNVGQQ